MNVTKLQVKNYILYNQNLFFKDIDSHMAMEEEIYNCVLKMGAIQIDSINIVERSQYITIWSRLGGYDKTVLDNLIYGDQKRLFEYWFHCASIIPLEIYRYRLLKMESYKNNTDKWAKEWLSNKDNVELMSNVYSFVKSYGKVESLFFKESKPSGGWWNRKPTKVALEQLYNRGELMIADRKNFCRIYDTKERVLPEWVIQKECSNHESIIFLLEYSAKCLGIFFLQELCDYTYFSKSASKEFVHELIQTKTILPFNVLNGETMYIHREKLKGFIKFIEEKLLPQKTTFLSPFDCLFWNKNRNKQIFNFEHVFEAYKKDGTRRWGYYNMPILYNGDLVGRVDPKFDRSRNTLILKSVFLEDNFRISEEFENAFLMLMFDFMKFNNASFLEIEWCSDTAFFQRMNKLLT